MLALTMAAESAHDTPVGIFLDHAWVIPAIPFVSFLLILGFGKRMPKGGSRIGIAALGLAWAGAVAVLVQWIQYVNAAGEHGEGALGAFVGSFVAEEGGHAAIEPIQHSFTWWQSGGLHLTAGSLVDGLSAVMLFTVTTISLLVHIYSTEYVKGDRRFTHYYAFLSLFSASMLMLVISQSTLQMLVSWELVGVCSFALIGHWWEEKKNSDAALKAFLTNRVGDMGLIIGVIILFFAVGSFGVVDTNLASLDGSIGHSTLLIASLCLMAAVSSKSGQFPLHTWLPDAMAGPTPVSALIHAATMVVAGVFLIARLYPVFYRGFSIFDGSLNYMAFIGGFTALMGACLAFVQRDIKKVLAYSTISQLGYMVAALGVGAWTAAIFHLFTHAFFKACLFLGAGSVSHAAHHSFDMKKDMGGLRKYMPTTFLTFLISSVALAGIPPLAGFWSKDEILLHDQTYATPIFIVLAIAALGTAFYVARQLIMVFFGKPRHAAAEHAAESPALMTTPLIVLAGLTVLGGLLNLPYLTRAMAEANHNHPAGIVLMLESWLEHSLASFELAEEGILALPRTPVYLSLLVAGISTALAVGGLLLGYLVYRGRPRTSSEPDRLARTPIWWWSVLPLNSLYMKGFVPLFNRFSVWLADKVDWAFWHDFVHDRVIRDIFVTGAEFSANVLDAQGVDGVVNGAGKTTQRLARGLRLTQTGYARTYALAVLLGAVGLLVYFLLMAG